MNLFDVYSLSHILHTFTQCQMAFLIPKASGSGGMAVGNYDSGRMMRALMDAETLFTYADMPDVVKAVRSAREQWNRPLLDMSAACEIAYRIQLDIIKALQDREFLRIADDRLEFILHIKGNEPHFGLLETFGPDVRRAFASASRDITEAGNCLAAECNTAAVFHLMRAAEIGLRALAADRNAPFKNKPIEQQEWGTILGFLDGEISRLRSAPAKNWPNPGIRDIQIRFYGEVVPELRAFNEAWRRHISHAREDGIYDRDYATSVLTHVRRFMQKLAERISEDSQTPEYWTQ